MPFDFLICSERSGSNLITKILDAHPEVCGPFPSHMIRTLALNINNYGDLHVDRNWTVLLEDMVNLLNNGIARWETDFTTKQVRQGVEQQSLAALIRFVYETEAALQSKRRLFIKENHIYTFLAYLLSHFPESKYLFLVRDPRDMALTWKEAASAHGAVKSAAQQWLEDQSRSLEVYGFLHEVGKILLVRFEDLITATEATTDRICKFLGITYTTKMLEFHKKNLVADNAGRMSSWQDLQKPIDPHNCNLFKDKLSENEIRYVEALCREPMEYFGYPIIYDDSIGLEDLDRMLPQELEHRDESGLTATERRLFPAFDAARQRIIERRV